MAADPASYLLSNRGALPALNWLGCQILPFYLDIVSSLGMNGGVPPPLHKTSWYEQKQLYRHIHL